MSELIERNIIDEIDALVDEQLSGYHARSGYDYNVNQQKCWHCGEDWHGLKITVRMREMRDAFWFGCRCDICQEDSDGVDSDYSYADDDSEVLCPGSSFIGPWATKEQIDRLRTARFLGDAPSNPWTHVRASSEPFDSTSWTLAELDFARRNYAIPVRYVLGVSEPGEPVPSYVPMRPLVRGDRVGFESSNGFRQELIIVDVVERGFTTEYRTEDPRYSARAQQFALDRERNLGRDAAVRGAEASQVTRTPQERALPRPSTTPPMWAVDAGRQRRTRTNSRGTH